MKEMVWGEISLKVKYVPIRIASAHIDIPRNSAAKFHNGPMKGNKPVLILLFLII